MNCQLKKIGQKLICKVDNPMNCLSTLSDYNLIIYNQYVTNFQNACYYLKLLKLEELNLESLLNLTRFTKEIEKSTFDN